MAQKTEDPSQQTLLYLDALGEIADSNPALNGLLLHIQSGIRKQMTVVVNQPPSEPVSLSKDASL